MPIVELIFHDRGVVADGSANQRAGSIGTPELADEGLVREVVHRIQNMRKDAGFEIADYITTYYERNELLDRVLKNTALIDYIKQETLSHAIVEGIPAEAYKAAHKIEGQEIVLGVKR